MNSIEYDYEKNLNELTDKQRQSVEYTEGPLLVIAGPGTGKTQLLSMRVAQILKKTDTNSSSILCLTFTNKAAANMRSRLQKLVGPEALQVNVKTFHSLSAEIMGEYPEYFWNGANLSTAPDAVQTDIIESILVNLPLDNPLALKFAGNYTSISRIKESLKLTKEAGLTPGKLKAIAEVNLAYIESIEDNLLDILPARLSYKALDNLANDIDTLPDQNIDETIKPLSSLSTVIKESLSEAIAKDEGTNKTKNTAAWRNKFIQSEEGTKGMHKQKRANQWWLNLANVYEMYRNELHNRGYYDYSDMLIEVISQLEKNSAMLSDIQERYQYIMIDEFQDSNAAQMRLAHLIASHPLDEGNPNLMVVGDDDQSIYKFNGAELNNMLSFQRSYPKTKTIVLEDNFRSSQAVLDVSKSIIKLADDRIVKRDPSISKELVARKKLDSKSEIIHNSYPSREYQLYAVAKHIHQNFDEKNKQGKTFAVLARKHDSLETIAGQLNRLKIPINYERQNNILDHLAIQQVITTCRVIRAINDGEETIVNQGISSLLCHPMWEIDSILLWQLAVSNRYKPHWLNSLLESDNEKFNSIGNWLLWLSQISKNSRLEIVLDYILGLRETEVIDNPYRRYYLISNDIKTEYIEALSAIQKLRHIVVEFSTNKHAYVDDFVKFIDLHEDNNIAISNESVFTTSSQAVQLLTVHKAKGLEFDNIYIIDAIEKEWQPSKRGSNTPANLPLQPYGDDMDDYIRLMYVAVTRAKQNIYVSSYRKNSVNEEVVATTLITSSMETKNIEQADIPEPVDVLESSIRWPILKTSDAKQILSPILDNLSLNVTSLINFLDVTKGGPELFLERNLLRLPGARTTSLAFGTAIHSALEQAQRLINRGEFDLHEIKSYFEAAIEKEPILPSELDRWKPHGLKLIDRLFGDHLILLPEGGTPEQKLSGIDINGAIIEGKLDHIIVDKESNSLLITDFKTGAPLRSFTSHDKSVQIKLWKHKIQLIFYALLAQNHPLYKDMHITCQMQYLEADNPKDIIREYIPSNEEIDRLANLSRAVYRKITNYDLPDISNYSEDIDGINKFENDLIEGLI